MSDLLKKDITAEQWREYEFGKTGERIVYRIKNPVTLFYREGGTTHRVLDSNGVVHCLPVPGEKGCVLSWKNKPEFEPCRF